MNIDRAALLELFRSEVEETLGDLDELFLALEAAPDDDLVAAAFRHFHNIKGNAAALGEEAIKTLAHAGEDLLDCLRRHELAVDEEAIGQLLEAVGLLRQLNEGREDAVKAAGELAARLAAAAGVVAPRSIAQAGDQPGEAAPPIVVQASAQRAREDVRTLRVGVGTLDRMLTLTGEIDVQRRRAEAMLLARPDGIDSDVLEAYRQADRLYLELQHLVVQSRLVGVGRAFRRHVRMLRDVASARGKLVQLALEGEDVEVDTAIVERLHDPLLHILNNAIDHGIEPPEARKAAGKDPRGRIALRAAREGGWVRIQVSDDGAGFPRERILEQARLQGLTGSEDLSDEEVYRLTFEPGLTTAEALTDTSGRGVGMDVVWRTVATLRGTVTIDSRPGTGSTITLLLPLTVTIIDGFGVQVDGETYILPLDTVVECVDLPARHRGSSGGGGVINLRGEAVPFLRLRDVFGLGGSPPPRESVVIVRYERGLAGLAVDSLLGISQAIIRPVGKLFEQADGVWGTAIVGTGRAALVLDVLRLLRRAAVAGAALC